MKHLAHSPSSTRFPAFVVAIVPLVALSAFSLLTPTPGLADTGQDALSRAIQASRQAEADLQRSEPEMAENGYRSALHEALLLLGSIEIAANQPEAAEFAFLAAGNMTLDDRRPRRALAALYQHSGRQDDAIRILRQLIAKHPSDVELQRSLAHTLFAAGRAEQAIGELRQSHVSRPDDPEAAFILATAYLKTDQADLAQDLFNEIVEARPIPQTHLLLGRTLRDFKQLDAARIHLEKALEMDPNLPRTRFYLATLALYSQGRAPYEHAVELFQAELSLLEKLGQDPLQDTTTHLFLGLTLAEIRRFEQAIPHLRLAAQEPSSARDAFHNLGRCLLELEQVDGAIEAFEKALQLAQDAAYDQLTSLHYQYAKALRSQGRTADAAMHFEAAKKSSGNLALDHREQLKRYLAGQPETEVGTSLPQLTTPALRQMPAEARHELKKRVISVLCRAYLNMGILQTRKQRFPVAIRLFEQAAALDPRFPNLQYSLGVSYFNAERFAEAAAALGEARAQGRDDAEVRRMLALAQLNAEAYAEAAELLASDPERSGNRSLEYAYALALVRSGQAEQAQPIFARLTGQNDWPELELLMGQAQAQDGNFPAAIAGLKKALQLNPGLPEAHATLGEIFLRTGELDSARDHLQQELELRPNHLQTRFHLATVLDLLQEHESAQSELHRILEADPERGDARYLLGKIMLADGRPEAALPQLEAAAGLAPEDANVHYQLGQTYQRLGRRQEAERAFALYRQLKKSQRQVP